MQTVIIKGHKVEIYKGYSGQEIFITKNGEKVYSARMAKNDSALRRAHKVISNQ